jgi:GNAT superfamily N-acetyltransferase
LSSPDGIIQYRTSLENIRTDQLEGFFVGWPNPPTPATHLEILKRATHVVLALDGSSVVGFVTAILDGILCAYIPLLEVLPSHQHQGIGSELMRRMLEMLGEIYMIDLLCDPARQVHAWDQEAIPPVRCTLGIKKRSRPSGARLGSRSDPARQVYAWDQEAIPTFKRFTRRSGWRNLLGYWCEILRVNLKITLLCGSTPS